MKYRPDPCLQLLGGVFSRGINDLQLQGGEYFYRGTMQLSLRLRHLDGFPYKTSWFLFKTS